MVGTDEAVGFLDMVLVEDVVLRDVGFVGLVPQGARLCELVEVAGGDVEMAYG